MINLEEKMLQNRVDPEGRLIITLARGDWMGNRGRIHNEKKEIVHSFRLKAWITCLLAFRGRRREVMAPNRYTELFFLDEATSFAAGHRPCFECRRKDYERFKLFWLKGNPDRGFDERTSIKEIDKVLHEERITKDGVKRTYKEQFKNLPDGAFILVGEQPFLVAGGERFEWSPYGYKVRSSISGTEHVSVLTPRSIINAFKAGYRPQLHKSCFARMADQ
ncbi:MAG: hypothetical protein J7539_06615 [Niabella sp.]|nr:hypothetical protein [Niabella sp.]